MPKSWSFAGVWNEALDTDRQRDMQSRDYVWASELGKGYYDRYWKMKGRKPTTPPNLRARRKFEAGNLTEWVMQQVLARAGVLQAYQEKLEDTTGPMRVSGRCDFMAGGQVHEIDLVDLGLPETFALVAETAIAKLRKKYPDGLREQGLEIKSTSGMMFESYLKAPSVNHGLQSYFYAQTTGKPYTLVYVSRDDLRVAEWVILPDSLKWEALYLQDLTNMAEVMETPENEADTLKEPLLAWDGEKFKKNWEVEYSLYLTDYGFERPDEYADPAASIARRLNNLIKKIKEHKPMTKVNEKTMTECYAWYPGAETIIKEIQGKYDVNK